MKTNSGYIVLNLLSLLAPTVATFSYLTLRFIPELPYGYRDLIAPTFYGFCVALAAMAFEFRLRRRIVCCLVVALLSSLAAKTFDVVLILWIAIVTGLVASGTPPVTLLHSFSNNSLRLVAQVMYRIIRAFIAAILALGATFAVAFLLSSTGIDPAAGGDITGAFGRFTFITYSFVIPLVMYDYLAKKAD